MPLLLLLLFQHAAATSPESSTSWNNFRTSISQQSLQNVLVSIEERLRTLDTLYSPRYAPRWEITIEQQSRRMETIESRLGRLETLLELKLDKLSEMLSTRQLKEELSKDQINQKLDSTYERLNHRLGYLEARLDVGIAKLQSNIEAGVGRLERLDTTAAARQSEMKVELIDIGSGVEDIRKQLSIFEDQQNSSLVIISENGKHIIKKMENLTSIVVGLVTEFNRTQSASELNDEEGTDQLESVKNSINTLTDKVINNIDRHANNFLTKANNMYNDMWRRIQILEGLVKDAMSLSNATRRELQDGIRTIAIHMGRRSPLQSDRERQDGSIDIALDTLGIVQRRLNELGRKFESSFQMLVLAQNLFLESCHRIQMDEPQLEAKLTKVLEKILDTITNRTISTDHELQILQETLQSQSNHIARTILHTNNRMLQASEKNMEDSKLLQLSILEVKEQLLESNKYIEDAISDIREDKIAATDRLDNILVHLQELQESFTELTIKRDTEKHKEDIPECPDSEQIVTEMLAEFERKGLIIFHENKRRTNKSDNNNNNMLTYIGKDIESDNETDDFFGAEDIFGEDLVEETDKSSYDSEAETTFRQHALQTKQNLHNEDITTDSRMPNSSMKNNNMTNDPVPLLRHRFDMQMNRNNSGNAEGNVDDFNNTNVTIDIVSHNNTEVDDVHNRLLEIDLHHVAAIIQNTDLSDNKQIQKSLTIIKSLPINETNIRDATQTKENKTIELNEDIQNERIKIFNIGETHTYHETDHSDSENISEFHEKQLKSSNVTFNINEGIKNDSQSFNKSNEEIKLHVKRDNVKDPPENNFQVSHQVFNTSEERKSKSTVTDITDLKLTNETEINVNISGNMPNITNEADINQIFLRNTTETQGTNILQRLIDFYNIEKSPNNLTFTDIWEKLTRHQNDQHYEDEKDTELFLQNRHNSTSSDLDDSQTKPISDTILGPEFDTMNNPINITNEKQQYDNKINEFSLEIVNRSDPLQIRWTESLSSSNISGEV